MTTVNFDEAAIRARVDEVTRLASVCTPGEWEEGETTTDGFWVDAVWANGNDVLCELSNPADAKFIAASRTLMPAMAADVSALLAECKRLRRDYERLRDAARVLSQNLHDEIEQDDMVFHGSGYAHLCELDEMLRHGAQHDLMAEAAQHFQAKCRAMEADARLGAAVRQMPLDTALIHMRLGDGVTVHEWSVKGEGEGASYGHTPDEALAARAAKEEQA